jgi:hypothetical protein
MRGDLKDGSVITAVRVPGHSGVSATNLIAE